jgi:hypothetical protein
LLSLAAACATASHELARGPAHDDLWIDGRWILREVHDRAPRGTPPLVRYHEQILLPGTSVFATRGEGPGLFPHHRGVFLGWNRVRHDGRSTDFWHLHDGARIVRDDDGVENAGSGFVRTAALAWIDGTGRTVLREHRRTRVATDGPEVLVLDYDITLATSGGAVELGGDAQHAGFQFRAADEVAEHPDATITLFSAGSVEVADVPASARGAVFASVRWAAQRYTIAGRRCTVLHCDHPGNPRPTVYGARPYGRFGAFPSLRLEPGQPARLRYRLAVLAVEDADPRVQPEALEQRWREFAQIGP